MCSIPNEIKNSYGLIWQVWTLQKQLSKFCHAISNWCISRFKYSCFHKAKTMLHKSNNITIFFIIF